MALLLKIERSLKVARICNFICKKKSKLLIFTTALVAEQRKDRGLKLNLKNGTQPTQPATPLISTGLALSNKTQIVGNCLFMIAIPRRQTE
jgi:hypothetical protein